MFSCMYYNSTFLNNDRLTRLKVIFKASFCEKRELFFGGCDFYLYICSEIIEATSYKPCKNIVEHYKTPVKR